MKKTLLEVKMKKELFGTLPSGECVHIYTLENDVATLKVLDRGGVIQSFTVFGVDVVGGFDTIEGYLADTSHQGALIGRVANRIGGARFEMNGKVYNLPKNDGENCLHGGVGFDYKMWTVVSCTDSEIVLKYTSDDMEEGFPSVLHTTVKYALDGTNLMIDYTATPEGDTPIALTNHAYFNLNGFGGTILSHKAVIYADKYTEVDDSLIPNGNRPCVVGTPFDFNTPHEIGERIGGEFIGYDHNLVLTPNADEKIYGLPLIANIEGDKIAMKVYTDQVGVQFYIGNFLGDGPDFKGGIKQVRHGAFCLETQTEPNCINHGIGFYKIGDTYKHKTIYSFNKK